MASISLLARLHADDIRAGMSWIIFYKINRSWKSYDLYSVNGYSYDNDPYMTLDADDEKDVREILEKDPNAVVLNGYYCGHFAEDMTAAEIARGIRWHYENGYNLLRDYTKPMNDDVPDAPADDAGDSEHETGFRSVIKALADFADAIANIFRDFDTSIQKLRNALRHYDLSLYLYNRKASIKSMPARRREIHIAIRRRFTTAATGG